MAEPFLGQITIFAGNFAPRGWAFCDGQLLAISQYSALFSLLGTTYGGDGRTTFALPDLRGRVPMHPGTGPGLSSYRLGQKGGTENTTLTTANLPAHTHGLSGFETEANAQGPTDAKPARTQDDSYAATGDAVGMGTTDAAGGAQSFSNIQPYLCVNYIIALQGLFPSRN